MHQKTQIRLGVYGIILIENKVLMVKTKTIYGNIINFPGGKIDDFESPQIALEREIKEELGTNISFIIKEKLYESQTTFYNLSFPDPVKGIYYRVDFPNITITEVQQRFYNNTQKMEVSDIYFYSKKDLPLDKILDLDKDFISNFWP